MADISLPDGVSQEEFLEVFRNYLKRGKDYRLIIRDPGGERGKGIEKGTLKELRELVKDMEESGELVEGSMVYITVSRYGGSYGGGVYEGYEVVDGKLVKSYKKYPWRMGRGRYGEEHWGEPWYEGKVPLHPGETRGLLRRLGYVPGSEEWKKAMEEASREEEE